MTTKRQRDNKTNGNDKSDGKNNHQGNSRFLRYAAE